MLHFPTFASGRLFVLAAIVAGLGLLAAAPKQVRAADEPAKAEPKIDFGREVQPILARKCFACHGPDKNEGGLRLNDPKSVVGKLDSGAQAIVPSKPDESELLKRVTAQDESERMPPKGHKPLTDREVDIVRRWIAAGAKWEDHWAFQPLSKPDLPKVKDAAWVRHPLDAFVLARLEAANLKPAAPADKIALLRRAYYDLIGLPPTPAEIDAFVADNSAEAFAKVVDRLLASPHYGERWGRHWLDVVRYAETNSFERDGPKPNAYKYRDYVIKSLNADKPYDQFVREQLAGDELEPVTPETIIATGFYRLGLWDDEPADVQQAKFDELDDLVATTGQAFLGLTINCARCHDHKIDPIPQTDYYRMLAFFHGIQLYGTRGEQSAGNQVDLSPADVAEQFNAREAKRKSLREQMTRLEQAGIVKMPAEDQRRTEGDQRERVLRDKLKQFLSEEQWTEYSAAKSELRSLNDRRLPPREMALAIKNQAKAPETFVMQRGNPRVPGAKVTPGFPQLYGGASAKTAGDGENPKGRRLALANWIASPENHLTARVVVNRMWQHHFGRGIVRSTNNFGYLGDRPTHPELLDYLAGEFVRGGWRMKAFHRALMLSSTYQMSSRPSPEALARDPANDLLARFDMRRLGAEELRDSILHVTGKFNPQQFGPSFYPTLSKEVLAGQSQPGNGWGNSSPAEQARRSIYIHVKRSLITPMLADFDFPETDSSCAARFATTQPGQALGLLNSEYIGQQAAELAARLKRDAGDDVAAQVKLALRLISGRAAADKDVQRYLGLIDRLQQKQQQSLDAAVKYFCLVALNLNEFVYLD